MLKSIREILDKKFMIPAYQRGYRWDKQQVRDLLDDILEFAKKKQSDDFYCLQPLVIKEENGKDTKTFYCLQPLIVKEVLKENNDKEYVVIDGQQRLTTIYLILRYLDDLLKDEHDFDNIYKIEYKTRKTSQDFLEKIKEYKDISYENIDYFHMSTAYKVIKEWFEKKVEEKEIFLKTLLGQETEKRVSFIWYKIKNENEIDDEKEIDVFTRLNMGKIPLTNAELIKAEFLKSQNFQNNEIKVKQIEIAKEWDEIELTLQNDEFWYFLKKDEPYTSRIELIFEILYDIKKDPNDPYNTFREFIKNKKDWEEIKKVFLTLKFWFEDRKLYHLIGFLLTTGDIVSSIYTEYKESETKKGFEKLLYNKIKGKIGEIEKINELEYGSHDSKIRNILLLFNIVTLLNNRTSHLRFAFDKYKKEKWTLEHIHPQTMPNIKDKQKWLENIKSEVKLIPEEEIQNKKENKKDELLEEISNFTFVENSEEKKKADDEFNQLATKVLNLFGDETSNYIDNLALLTGNDNSSLKNEVFPTKRKKIIEKDKTGSFIPICTKNVFLKYYTSENPKLYFWSETDRENYLKAIETTLNEFLGENK